jgi:hypothetical protein
MSTFKFLDVVKWVGALNDAEMNDVMVVEDVDDDFVTVRHLENSQLSKEREINLRFVGRCTPYENVKDIIERYKKS